MLKIENNTNKKFYVVQVGPCEVCGFAGKIFDPKQNKVITCPECKGTGKSETWQDLEVAIRFILQENYKELPHQKRETYEKLEM